jgi:hypothetical protein
VQFKGMQAYDQAIQWGKKNLENFHLDMIKVVYLDHHLSSSNSNK